MKVSVYNVQGEVVGDVDLNESVFGVATNVALMHQAVVQQRANHRVGTASTKTRAVIRGTTKKMYKQKGTGRARHGSRKVPLWKGGGVAHGPHPRSYEQHMPKKMRRAAIKSALSVKARDNQIIVLDALTFDEPRTKAMIELLARLPVSGKVLLAMDAFQEAIVLSARNVPRLYTCPATGLNTYDLLNNDYVVTTVPAIRQVEAWLTTVRRHGVPQQPPAAAAEPAAVATEETAPKPVRRTRAKAAAEPAEETAGKPAPKAAAEAPATDAKPARAPRARKAAAEPSEGGEATE